MALLGSVVDTIVPDTQIEITGDNLDTVTDVNLHSPSGDTIVDQTIVEQTETSLVIETNLGGVPLGDGATLEVVDGSGDNVTEVVSVEPLPNQTFVDVTEAPATNTVADPTGVTLEQGDQIRYSSQTGDVLSDGQLNTDEKLYVQIWDASTETWSEPVLVEPDSSGNAVQGSRSMGSGSIQRHATLERADT